MTGRVAQDAHVTVVIPNWNGMEHLPECLSTLDAQEFTDFDVIVVDNDSADESCEWLARERPDVRVVARPDNGGFSKAVNEGIRRARGPYVALLNNDTALDRLWLGELVRALEARPEYDIAASRMVYYDDPTTINAAGDVYSVWAAVGRNRGIGQPVDRYLEPARVLGASAGAALYRASLFEHIGLFDEDFFLLSEDTDINLRALIAGHKALYVPSSMIRHKASASINTMQPWPIERLRLRNNAIVVAKDLPFLAQLPFLLARPWTSFRNSVPLRPSKWRLVRQKFAEQRRRDQAISEGLRIGRARRSEVWGKRRASRLEIVRWLLKGERPLR